MQIRWLVRTAAAALIVLAASVAPTRADYRAAVSAFESGDYESARREFQALADRGDTRARFSLGIIFKDGFGVQKNSVAALGWFLCAAQADDHIGRDALRWAKQLASSLDQTGIGVAKEQALACRQPSAAATQPATSSAAEGSGTASAPKESGTGSALVPTEFETAATKEAIDLNLERLLQDLSHIEIGAPNISAIARPSFGTGSSSSDAGSFFLVPKRETLWSKAFFLPADGTVVGSQHVAWQLGADELYRDLRSVAHAGDDLALGALAVIWWLLIAKTLYSVATVLLRTFGVSVGD